jgi:hypothetical protein
VVAPGGGAKRRMSLGRLIVCLGLVLGLRGAAPAEDARGAIASVAAPYRFDAIRWMVSQWVHGGAFGEKALGEAPSALVWRYLAITRDIERLEQERGLAVAREPDRVPAELEAGLARLRASQRSMQPGVERALTSQIQATLVDLGIRSPADGWAAWTPFFPPISFRLENPPQLLVVSPRDRIESVAQIMLVQDLDLTTALDIESEVEALGYSALVTGIGGFGGTYPTFVAESSSLRWTIETATEEWFHQYLAFTPVGSRYVLHLVGWRPDYEIARINETVAGFVASEVADQVLDRYYGGGDLTSLETVASEFDYTRFMRETRMTVDRLLADGEVEAAEAYMEARRQELVARGYAVRKLNQAYFAFHGTYTYGPAAVDPIYEEIKLLRSKSASLSTFVQAASRLTSRAHLRALLELPAPEQASRRPDSVRAIGACARTKHHGTMGA